MYISNPISVALEEVEEIASLAHENGAYLLSALILYLWEFEHSGTTLI